MSAVSSVSNQDQAILLAKLQKAQENSQKKVSNPVNQPLFGQQVKPQDAKAPEAQKPSKTTEEDVKNAQNETNKLLKEMEMIKSLTR